MKKVYIYRITNHNGRKEYKRTKCCDYWTTKKEVCWQFSKQGAKKILETLNEFKRTDYYTYGIETIDA